MKKLNLKVKIRNEKPTLRSDLIGLIRGKLKIIRFSGVKNGHTYWVAKCNCGNEKVVLGCDFKRGKAGLKCSQCHLEDKRKRATKHGETNSQFYRIWHAMKNRIDNLNYKGFDNYSGRGIVYDPKWKTFIGFKEDMKFKYLYAFYQVFKREKSLSLERINVNGNYCFDNCIFIPMKLQNKNQQKNKWFKAISPEGEVFYSKNQRKFAREHSLSQGHIGACLRKEEIHHKLWRFVRIKQV